jgi:hypothetical protein
VDFACLKAGTVRVPLNSRLSVLEHAQMLAETGARILVFSPHLASRASEALREVRMDGSPRPACWLPAPHQRPGLEWNGRPHAARPVRKPGEPVSRLLLLPTLMARNTIRGRTLTGDQAQAGVRVLALDPGLEECLASTESDAAGSYTLDVPDTRGDVVLLARFRGPAFGAVHRDIGNRPAEHADLALDDVVPFEARTRR